MVTKKFVNFLTIISILVGILSIEIKVAHAEPYISVRTGFKCSQCHVNRSGGGKRTSFGMIYAQSKLNMKFIRPAGKSGFFDGKLAESVSVGANFRADNVSLFSFLNSTGKENAYSNNSRISEANIYFQFDVIPDFLTVYADQTLQPNANREFFGLIQNLPLKSYVKIGRMLLPFGFRLLDNDAFIRNGSGYTYNRHDTGLEVGVEPGPLSIIANVTDNQFSLMGATVFRRFRLGGSFGRNMNTSGDYVFGAFAGVNFGRFTLLGEGDFITIADVERFAGLAELNFLIRQGLNFKAVYEFFDRDRDIPNDRDGQERITLGVEPFITQFMQVGIFYRINRYIPQNVLLNQDQLTVQFHVFF